MKTTWILRLTVLFSVALSACGSAPAPQDTQTSIPTSEPPPPSSTPKPATSPQPPTRTPMPPTATPLPEGVLFRDDFEGSFQPEWEWINENPDKWSFVDFGGAGWLQIVGDKPGGFAEQSNTLMRPLPEGEFEIRTHAIADPRQNHHQANIFIFQDESNYIRLNFGFCDHCGLSQGYGYFMETVIENNPFGDFYAVERDPEETDVYLRLVNLGGSITGYHSLDNESWDRIGAFGNYFDFRSVGLGATNSVPPDWEVEDIEALFEYFEIRVLD